jgi:hypothetical protein
MRCDINTCYKSCCNHETIYLKATGVPTRVHMHARQCTRTHTHIFHPSIMFTVLKVMICLHSYTSSYCNLAMSCNCCRKFLCYSFFLSFHSCFVSICVSCVKLLNSREVIRKICLKHPCFFNANEVEQIGKMWHEK